MDELSIEKARARLGPLVHDAQNGTATVITRNGKPAAMVAPLSRLTDSDRRLAARARELAAAQGTDAMRAIAASRPGTDDAMVRVEALGVAKYLLGELAAIIGRLDGPAAAQDGAGMAEWIMLIEDHHGVAEPRPFSNEERAIAAARAIAGHDGVTREEMPQSMRDDGWVLICPMSEERDRIRVVKRTMDS